MRSDFSAIVGGVAGVILYIVYAIVHIILLFIDMAPSPGPTGSMYYTFGYLMYLLTPATAAFAGLLTAILSGKQLRSLREAATVSAIAGGIACIAFTCIYAVDPLTGGVMFEILWKNLSSILWTPDQVAHMGFVSGWVYLCIPGWLVIIIASAAICGTAYAALKLKLK